MKAASVSELKKELTQYSHKQIADFCIRLIKYKRENKELLTYLIYEAPNEELYIKNIQDLLDELFLKIPIEPYYISGKMLRKALRIAKKFIKFSGNKKTEVEVLLHFCKLVRKSKLGINKSISLHSIYEKQLFTIEKSLTKLDEDLQFDYQPLLDSLKKL